MNSESHKSDGSDAPGKYIVRSGDCITSIAEAHGLFWKTLWDDPANERIRKERKNPNLLAPGDELVVPEKRIHNESGATEKKHRFRKKGVPAKISFRVMDGGKPRSGQPYLLIIDGRSTKGELDEDGRVEISIPPGAVAGVLRAGDPPQEYQLRLGQLDPITTVAGVQARLNSVGYNCGPVNGVMGAETIAAVRRFQQDEGLEVTGKIEVPVTDALQKRFGC